MDPQKNKSKCSSVRIIKQHKGGLESMVDPLFLQGVHNWLYHAKNIFLDCLKCV